jgi:hypothetical protein
MPKAIGMDMGTGFDAIGERSAYLIPWLERHETISLKRLSESFDKDEAAQQAELDMVRGAIARLVGARDEIGTGLAAGTGRSEDAAATRPEDRGDTKCLEQ